MIQKIRFIMTALLLFLFLNIAKAQEIEDLTDKSLEELLNMSVTTASKSAQKLSDAPATMYVVTAEQIRQRGYSSLEDLLEDLPEVEIQKRSYSGASNMITMRGMWGNPKFVILLDGIRMGSPTGSTHSVSGNYPIHMAQRIEIIMGPASALYGADAYSGIINIITHKGSDFKNAEAKTSFGMFNTTDNALVAGFGSEDVSFQVAASLYSSDGANLPELFPDDFKWFNEKYSKTGEMDLFGSPKTLPIKEYATPFNEWFVSARANIKNLQVGFAKNYSKSSSSLGAPDFRTLYWDDAAVISSMESFYLSHQYSDADEKLSINSQFSFSSFEWNPESKYINNYSGYFDAYKYDYNSSSKFEEQLGYRFNENSSLVAGVSYEILNVMPKTGDLLVPFDKSVPVALQNLIWPGSNVTTSDGRDLTLMQDFLNLTYSNIGSYIQYQHNLNNWLKLTVGTRYDFSSRYGSSLNPRAGAVIQPTEKLKFKLLYGRAFLAPPSLTAYEQYGSFYPVKNGNGDITGLASGFLHLANPDLKPAVNNAYEFAMLYLLNENFTLSFNAFLNDQTDLIGSSGTPNGSYKGIPVGFIEKPVNSSESEAYGGTLRADMLFDLGAGSNLRTSLSYSYVDGDIDDEPLVLTAKHTGKLIVTYYNENLSISLDGIYRSESHLFGSTNATPLVSDGFFVANLFASYKLPFNISVFAKADNLLNAKYYTPSQYSNKWPQYPLTVLGGISYRLK